MTVLSINLLVLETTSSVLIFSFAFQVGTNSAKVLEMLVEGLPVVRILVIFLNFHSVLYIKWFSGNLITHKSYLILALAVSGPGRSWGAFAHT